MRGISYRKLLLATHIVSILLVAGIYAQPTRETAPKVGRVELKQPSEFDVWVDSFVAESGSGQDTPLAIVIVKNDRVLFSKGYGFLDSQQKYPVDPERTIFRAASISKLFTTVAVMKLVEQGKLDLDADLNRYLQGFQIESNPLNRSQLHTCLLTPAGSKRECSEM